MDANFWIKLETSGPAVARDSASLFVQKQFINRVHSRSFDLLHAGLAIALGATEFLTFDTRQAALAKAAGLKVKSG